MSVKDARNTVATAYASGLLEDEEFLKLYDDFKPLYPSYSYWDFAHFLWIHLILTSVKPTLE